MWSGHACGQPSRSAKQTSPRHPGVNVNTHAQVCWCPHPPAPSPGTPYFIDELLTRAFGGIAPFTTDPQRVQTIVKTLESSLQFAYMMHLFDEAITNAK